MAKSKSHHKPHSKSKVVHKSAQQGLIPFPRKAVAANTSKIEDSTSPAFSAANASLQNVSAAKSQAAAQESLLTKVAPVEIPSVEVETVAHTAPAKAQAAPPVAQKTPLQAEPELELAPQFAAPVKDEAQMPAKKTPLQNVLPAQIVRDAGAHPRGVQRGRGSWKSRPGAWIGGTLGALLLVAGGAAAGAYSKFASSETIAPNVSIAGVDVGGLSLDAAKARVLSHFGTPKIVLLCDGERISMPVDKLGVKLSIEPTVKKAYLVGRDGYLPNNLLRVYGRSENGKNLMLPIEWNKTQLVKGLSEVNSKVAIKPVDARLRAASFGLEVVPDREGRALNVGAAAHLLQRRYYVGLASLGVPSRKVEAKISARSLDGRDVQLAQHTTSFNAGLSGRVANLRIACRAIQNHVLMPGETFSFNACTGERVASKGYRMAHIFLRQPGAEQSEVVDGLAGGVCQVSSTLFNAVRKTNLKANINPIKIVERNSHSLPVTYVPRGLDATVAWPYKDFKFRNITNHPIYVRTQMGRSNVSISIWGRIPRV